MAWLLPISILTAAAAQPVDRMSAVKSVTCEFSAVASSGGTSPPVIRTAKLTMAFERVDVEDGTASVLGDFGPSEIIVRLSGTTLHFMQSFREGPIYLTTVFLKETKPGRFLAAHTRHEYTDVSLPGFTSRPEQYYGDCEIQP